jgi:hypothetical protein
MVDKRLPGVLCEASQKPRGRDPLRLDTAAFVGFAERGPVDTPVLLEDFNQYQAVFGGDLMVAQYDGRPVYAHLPRVVEAFFQNGGSRCYAVRVVGEAAAAHHFELPGLKTWTGENGASPVRVAAAWVGDWSESLKVGTRLRVGPLTMKKYRTNDEKGIKAFEIVLPADLVLKAGDVLRLHKGGTIYLAIVKGVTHRRPTAGTESGVVFSVQLRTLLKTTPDLEPSDPPESIDHVELLRFDLLVREGDAVRERHQRLSFSDWRNGLAQPLDAGESAADILQKSTYLSAPKEAVFLPVNMSESATFKGAKEKLSSDKENPEDAGGGDGIKEADDGLDGLNEFDPESLFLDPELRNASFDRLMNAAQQILYQDQPARSLKGIHSLLPLDDVALIAIPDAVHRRWSSPASDSESDSGSDSEPKSEREWWPFGVCREEPSSDKPSGGKGQADQAPKSVLASLPRLEREQAYTDDGLRKVQEALATMCAARADMLAVLSLPNHFKRADVLKWRGQFTGISAFRGTTALSYAAVYHGWVEVLETHMPELAPRRAVPPDGVVAGMIARREQARGAWIAPANEPLNGALALTPSFSEADWHALYKNQVNVLRRQPGRYTLMSADTLSQQTILEPISVRRLLIYLRKLLLRRAEEYVFETNNARFRRLVQTTLARELERLFEQGALHAYEVDVSDRLDDLYRGRLLVEIKIAPTAPIEFITVALLRAGENLLQISER